MPPLPERTRRDPHGSHQGMYQQVATAAPPARDPGGIAVQNIPGIGVTNIPAAGRNHGIDGPPPVAPNGGVTDRDSVTERDRLTELDRLQGACNQGPVCTQGYTAARVSKRGTPSPENGAMGRENGLALFLHRFTGNLASIS